MAEITRAEWERREAESKMLTALARNLRNRATEAAARAQEAEAEAEDACRKTRDMTRCVATTWDNWSEHQCSRPQGHGFDGLYCKQHAKKHPA